MKVSRMLILLVLLGAFFVLAACGGMADGHAMADTSTAEMGEADMHADTTDNDGDQAHDGGEMMDGMMMDHGVPEEAEAVANPIPATEPLFLNVSSLHLEQAPFLHDQDQHL